MAATRGRQYVGGIFSSSPWVGLPLCKVSCLLHKLNDSGALPLSKLVSDERSVMLGVRLLNSVILAHWRISFPQINVTVTRNDFIVIVSGTLNGKQSESPAWTEYTVKAERSQLLNNGRVLLPRSKLVSNVLHLKEHVNAVGDQRDHDEELR